MDRTDGSDSSFSALVCLETSVIPIDLFISRKRTGFTYGDLTFLDSKDNLVFRVVEDRSSKSTATKLVDSTGNLLISISRNHDRWQGYKGDSNEAKNLIFSVERASKSSSKKELTVFLVGDDSKDSESAFGIRGSPFQRSCTIYQGNSIVAQTKLIFRDSVDWE